jgi:hypothetical protein
MKKRNLFFGLLGLIAATTILSTSCTSTSKEVLFNCDSTNVSFAASIKPILVNNCNTCHSTTNAPNLGSGIVLDNYTDIINSGYVDDSTTIANGGDGGRFYTDVVLGKMPKNATKLSVCDIAKIKNWVFAGAKNN